MKKLLLIGLLALSFTTYPTPSKTAAFASYSLLCEGVNRDGGKVKLVNHQGKNYIIYYDRNDCQIGNSVETSMQVKDFTLWCAPLGYNSTC